MLTMGELVADFLKTRGVTHIFGLPGGENVPLLEAFRQAGLIFVLTHHEASPMPAESDDDDAESVGLASDARAHGAVEPAHGDRLRLCETQDILAISPLYVPASDPDGTLDDVRRQNVLDVARLDDARSR